MGDLVKLFSFEPFPVHHLLAHEAEPFRLWSGDLPYSRCARYSTFAYKPRAVTGTPGQAIFHDQESSALSIIRVLSADARNRQAYRC